MIRFYRRGVSSIEFALILPVLMMLLTGVFDYGWYFINRSAAQNAVKDATRIAVAARNSTDPRAIARSNISAILQDQGLTCAADCVVSADVHTTGGYLVLTSSINWGFDPLVGFIPTPTAIVIDHTMLMEHQTTTWYSLP